MQFVSTRGGAVVPGFSDAVLAGLASDGGLYVPEHWPRITPAEIANLHQRGIYVMCYFSAGSWEDWRSDAHLFPEKIIGNDYDGWPGEKWLDVRKIVALKPIMESRIRMAAEKGCDGVDPDHVDGYTNETGFPLTYEDQLVYNKWLSQTAHTYDLEIGLKNDIII